MAVRQSLCRSQASGACVHVCYTDCGFPHNTSKGASCPPYEVHQTLMLKCTPTSHLPTSRLHSTISIYLCGLNSLLVMILYSKCVLIMSSYYFETWLSKWSPSGKKSCLTSAVDYMSSVPATVQWDKTSGTLLKGQRTHSNITLF